MQLQKSPIGLLGAFALKVLGRNPQAFGDTITPTVDVYDQYLAQGELKISTLSSNVNLATFNARSFTVPAGKAWRLIGLGGNYTPNAADVAVLGKLSGAITSPDSAPLAFITGSSGGGLAVAVGAAGVNFGQAFRPPIFLPSGWSVAVTLVSATAWTVAAPFAAELMLQEIDT